MPASLAPGATCPHDVTVLADGLHGMQRLLSLFETSSLLCLYLAIASLAAFQIFGIILRSGLHWRQRQKLSPTGSHTKFGGIPVLVPTPVFMRLMQNVAEEAVARPEASAEEFKLLLAGSTLAHDASADNSAGASPASAELSPAATDRLEAIQAHADLVLDRMQAAIEAAWLPLSKATIAATAVFLSLLGAWVVSADGVWAAWLGLIAGLLASFAKDMAVALVRRR